MRLTPGRLRDDPRLRAAVVGSELGVLKDWELWHGYVVEGGTVVLHDARASQPGGRRLPGPTAVVDRLFRGPRALPDWEIAAGADRAVAVTCAPRAA
jgi:hypothetical protein